MGIRDWIQEARGQAARELGRRTREDLEQEAALEPGTLPYKVHHVMPGRLRLGFPSLRSCGDLARGMAFLLAAEPGVTRARGNPLCGSVVVEFDPDRADPAGLLRAVDAIPLRDLLRWRDRLPPLPDLAVPLQHRKGWILGGHIFLGLGVLGYALPILPGTPLLLCSAACYLRGSEHLYRWLLEHPVLGPPVRNYYAGLGIPRRAKVYTIGFLWLSASVSLAMFVGNPYLVGLLLLMATGTTGYLLSLPTAPRPGTVPA